MATPGSEVTTAESELESDLDEGDDAEDMAPEPEAGTAAPSEAQAGAHGHEEERGPFSFISWLRRSNAEKATEKPPSSDEHGEE